ANHRNTMRSHPSPITQLLVILFVLFSSILLVSGFIPQFRSSPSDGSVAKRATSNWGGRTYLKRDSKDQGKCGNITNCGHCTSQGTCVWCESDNTCQKGNFYGPEDGIINGCKDWRWRQCKGIVYAQDMRRYYVQIE